MSSAVPALMCISMEEPASNLAAALVDASRLVAALSLTNMTRPTPCVDWTVSDLVRHMIAVTSKFNDFAAGHTDSPRTVPPDVADTQLRDAWAEVSARSQVAWSGVDYRRVCHLPFGTFSAGEAAAINTFDIVIHSWDLARALGRRYSPKEPLLNLARQVAVQLVTPEAIAAGHYRQPNDKPGPDWQSVLAFTGRAPVN